MILIGWIFILLIAISLYFDWKKKQGEEHKSKEYIRNFKVISLFVFFAVGICVFGMLN